MFNKPISALVQKNHPRQNKKKTQTSIHFKQESHGWGQKVLALGFLYYARFSQILLHKKMKFVAWQQHKLTHFSSLYFFF